MDHADDDGTARDGGTHEPITAAGRTILRSTLSFSVNADPRDRSNAWEMPRETIVSSAQHEGLSGRRSSDGTEKTLNRYFCYSSVRGDLLCRLKDVFGAALKARADREAYNKHAKRSGRKSKRKKAAGDSTANGIGRAHVSEEDDDDEKIAVSPDPLAADSDDDIFGGIGEYIPPSAATRI